MWFWVSRWLLPLSLLVAPAIGLPRPPPVPGPHNPTHDRTMTPRHTRACPHPIRGLGRRFAAGPGEQRTGDEQGNGDRNGSLPVPIDEARDRDGLELGKSAINAYMHLRSFVKDVGERVCRSAPDALRPGSGAAVKKSGLGVVERRSSPRVWFSGSDQPLRRWTHYGQGLAPQRRTPDGGWSKAQSAQGLVEQVNQRPAVDALHPGLGTARRNAGWGLAKDAVQPGFKFLGDCCVRERESNTVQPVATPSATRQIDTTLQWQASSL